MANRAIKERDRIDDVFRVVYGEMGKEDISKDTSTGMSGLATPGQS